MRRFADGLAGVAAICAAGAALVSTRGCVDFGARDWLQMGIVAEAAQATPAGCDGPITRTDGVEINLTRDDRYGAAEARVWGATALGSRCTISMHLGYVRRDGPDGPFTWTAEARNLILVGAPEGPLPEGVAGEPLEIGRPERAAIPSAGAALHALTLAAGDAVTLAASGDGAANVGVWLGGIALPWARTPGLAQQEFFVAPLSGTYTVRISGDAGKAYVVFAVHGGSSGTKADDNPPVR